MADAVGIAPAQTSTSLNLNAPREFADPSTRKQVPVVPHLLTDETVGLVEVINSYFKTLF